MNIAVTEKQLSPADFTTDQEVRWCPGCGDYAILKAVRTALTKIGTPPENVAFISGIGCAARFPYYISSYGFHTIHGRSPAVATGVKLTNPELDVWVVGGDGDMLSIGVGHTMHALRRNVDINILLFNNEIYGLTKGQYSPTSRTGTITPSSPEGSIDQPASAALLAIGSGATFIARAVDTQQKIMPDLLVEAHAHKGTSFTEIFQNCIVYNDNAFDHFTGKKAAADNQLQLVDGEPMLFGKGKEKGIRLNVKTLSLEAVTLGEDGVTLDDILVHDKTNKTLAGLLAGLESPEMPVALGILYQKEQAEYVASAFALQQKEKGKGINDLDALFRKGHTWEVE
jgi:2-oxoglutarate ferredoxin oxidoreductase subunit beta